MNGPMTRRATGRFLTALLWTAIASTAFADDASSEKKKGGFLEPPDVGANFDPPQTEPTVVPQPLKKSPAERNPQGGDLSEKKSSKNGQRKQDR